MLALGGEPGNNARNSFHVVVELVAIALFTLVSKYGFTYFALETECVYVLCRVTAVMVHMLL